MQDKIKIQMIALQQLLSLLPQPLLPKNEPPLLPHPPQRNKRIIIHQQLLPPFPQVFVVHVFAQEFPHELLHPQEDKSPIVASI